MLVNSNAPTRFAAYSKETQKRREAQALKAKIEKLSPDEITSEFTQLDRDWERTIQRLNGYVATPQEESRLCDERDATVKKLNDLASGILVHGTRTQIVAMDTVFASMKYVIPEKLAEAVEEKLNFG